MPKRNSAGFSRKELVSNIVSEFVGDRLYDGNLAVLDQEKEKGILTQIFDGTLRFVGFSVKSLLKGIAFSFVSLYDLIVDVGFSLASFDWNSSDKEIFDRIGSNNSAIGSALGRFLGGGLVWLTSITISAGFTVKYPVVAGRIALALAEEGGLELRSSFQNVIGTIVRSIIDSAVLLTYWSARKVLFGHRSQKADPWIFADKVEKTIEKVVPKSFRSFVNSFLDASLDALIDVGYVIAYTLDDYYEASLRARTEREETDRDVILTPDPQIPDEEIRIFGSQDNIEQSIMTTLTAHSLVENRDVGTIVARPWDDNYKAQPQVRRISLLFCHRSQPPFKTKADNFKKVEINIPDAITVISWQRFKEAVKRWTWGEYLCVAKLDNGRQFQIYGATSKECVRKVQEISVLTTAKIIKSSVSKPEIENIRRKKRPQEVYPAYATAIVRKSTVGEDDYATIDGQNIATSKIRVPIWVDDEPEDFKYLFQKPKNTIN